MYPRVLDTNQGELSGHGAELTGRTRPGGCIAEAGNGNSPHRRAWWSMTQVWFQPIYLRFFFTFIIFICMCVGTRKPWCISGSQRTRFGSWFPLSPVCASRIQLSSLDLLKSTVTGRGISPDLLWGSQGSGNEGHYPFSTRAQGRLGALWT